MYVTQKVTRGMHVRTFRMSHADRIPKSEGSDVLAVPETDLPTHVGADDTHAEQDARHRRAVTPVEDEIGHKSRIRRLAEHGRPDVDVGLHRLLNSVERGHAWVARQMNRPQERRENTAFTG